MRIVINVDELRSISSMSVKASEKMDEANGTISTVVSSHDWKCPERVPIDQALERIKDNSVMLNNAFVDFANQITEIANDYTEFINDQGRFDTTYMDDVADLLSQLSSTTSVSNTTGRNTSSIVSSMAAESMNTANIASLYGADHGISIMDFSLFTE